MDPTVAAFLVIIVPLVGFILVVAKVAHSRHKRRRKPVAWQDTRTFIVSGDYQSAANLALEADIHSWVYVDDTSAFRGRSLRPGQVVFTETAYLHPDIDRIRDEYLIATSKEN